MEELAVTHPDLAQEVFEGKKKINEVRRTVRSDMQTSLEGATLSRINSVIFAGGGIFGRRKQKRKREPLEGQAKQWTKCPLLKPPKHWLGWRKGRVETGNQSHAMQL
jgi:hypothetical protein